MITTLPLSQSTSGAQVAPVASRTHAPLDTTRSASPGGDVSLSARGLALFQLVKRSEEKMKRLSPQELGALAERTAKSVLRSDWRASPAAAATETSTSGDSARVDAATTAALFIKRHLAATSSAVGAENPLFGRDRSELVAILYDESGEFTIDERRSAFVEMSRQRSIWEKEVCTRAEKEYDATGRQLNFFKEVLAAFDGLTRIEQTQYPQNYAERLQMRIDREASADVAPEGARFTMTFLTTAQE